MLRRKLIERIFLSLPRDIRLRTSDIRKWLVLRRDALLVSFLRSFVASQRPCLIGASRASNRRIRDKRSDERDGRLAQRNTGDSWRDISRNKIQSGRSDRPREKNRAAFPRAIDRWGTRMMMGDDSSPEQSCDYNCADYHRIIK